ncbi:hypothetical protein B0H11DRAFT_1909858 [Mycena galericulata]|nr:hypothetical protein B0H11DRAFT_1909858 [Mycena galericulata]
MSRKIERSDVAPHNHVVIEKKARTHGELASETLDKLVDGSKECRGIQEAADVAEGTCPGDVVKRADGRVREEEERGALLHVLLADEDRRHPRKKRTDAPVSAQSVQVASAVSQKLSTESERHESERQEALGSQIAASCCKSGQQGLDARGNWPRKIQSTGGIVQNSHDRPPGMRILEDQRRAACKAIIKRRRGTPESWVFDEIRVLNEVNQNAALESFHFSEILSAYTTLNKTNITCGSSGGTTRINPTCFPHQSSGTHLENILLKFKRFCRYPAIRITDFELALRQNKAKPCPDVRGTISYLPPEAIRALDNSELKYFTCVIQVWYTVDQNSTYPPCSAKNIRSYGFSGFHPFQCIDVPSTKAKVLRGMLNFESSTGSQMPGKSQRSYAACLVPFHCNLIRTSICTDRAERASNIDSGMDINSDTVFDAGSSY